MVIAKKILKTEYDLWKKKEDEFYAQPENKQLLETSHNAFFKKKEAEIGPWRFIPSTPAETWQNRSIACGVVAGLLQIAQWWVSHLINRTDDQKDREILRNRQLRILDKIRTIESRVRTMTDEIEIQQLERAKDYFKRFWNQNQEDAAVIRHEHHHHTYYYHKYN